MNNKTLTADNTILTSQKNHMYPEQDIFQYTSIEPQIIMYSLADIEQRKRKVLVTYILSKIIPYLHERY